ncbi:MAG: hypothetical protein QW331_04340 [Candidatus Woesearchaeota archaeon]
MALREPESMDECVYHTIRKTGDASIRAWVFREKCPKCKKALMGKYDEKGNVKIRQKEYRCLECGYVEGKDSYENKLMCNIQYQCGKCKNEGEMQVPFKRKKVKRFDEEEGREKMVDAVVFECQKCKEKIYITKKMK